MAQPMFAGQQPWYRRILHYIRNWRTDHLLYEYVTGYLFIIPGLVLFSIFTLYPLAWAFVLSFQRFRVLGNEWVGFDNYIRLFTGVNGEVFIRALLNTTLYTLVVVTLGLGATLFLASLIRPLPKRVQNFFKGAYYLPSVTSGIVLSLVWLWIYDPLKGLMNYLIGLIGIAPQNWLGNPNLALAAVMFMVVAGGHGASIILTLAAMGNIPNHLYEAADLDAASPWTKFTRITIPLIKPTILYMVVIGIIGSFQVFELVYILTQGGPMFATTTLAYLIYQTAFINANFGYAAAQAFVLALIVVIMSSIQFRLLGTDVEY